MGNLHFPERAPTFAELRLFAVLTIIYIGLSLAILPWAREPGVADPHISAVSAGAVLIASFCIALLLGAFYLASGKAPLLLLTCGYCYSSLMAGLHIATFSGVAFAGPLFGNEQTVSWLFLAWRAGTAAIFLAAVLLENAGPDRTPDHLRARYLWLGLSVTCAGGAAIAFIASLDIAVLPIAGDRWTGVNHAITAFSALLCLAGIVLIWLKHGFNRTLYLWLALVLTAMIIDLMINNAGGGRYTVGWHASRANYAVSAYLLLAFLMSELSEQQRGSALTFVGAYGGAFSAMLAAIFLRWSLDPWIGVGVPYITLFAAAAISVWIGGWAPAALSTMLGYFIANTLFIEPRGSVTFLQTADVLQFVVFVVGCSLIIVLGETMRRARDRYRTSEAALKERAAELQRADSNKSQFLALLAHELRNPMAPLRTGLAILRLSPDSQAAVRTREMMERQIDNLTRLIDDLLDVSRIDRGKLELHIERVSVDEVVRAAIETALPGIEEKKHGFKAHYAGRPLFIEADPVRLGQVLTNLLNNAAKFTPPGGCIELKLSKEGPDVVITVTDTGIGLTPEHLEAVFDMFVQIDPDRTAGGLGLGLTLVRSIVERHGGSVQARSAGAGRGAEFMVRLPLADAPPVAAEPATAISKPAAAGRRILIADDNTDAAATIAELLRHEGHRVETAHDGAAALQIARSLRPDVAFIDLNMPVMDGYELARRLQPDESGRSIKLIAVTGMGQAADIERTKAAGFDIHLTKPADPDLVLRIAAGAEDAGKDCSATPG